MSRMVKRSDFASVLRAASSKRILSGIGPQGRELALLNGLEQLAFVLVQGVFDLSLFIGGPLEHISVCHVVRPDNHA